MLIHLIYPELLGQTDRDEDEEEHRPRRMPDPSWRNEFGLELETHGRDELPVPRSNQHPPQVEPPDYDLEFFRQRLASNPSAANLASLRLLMENMNYLLSGTHDFAERLVLANDDTILYNSLREDRARHDHELQELYDQLTAMQELQGNGDEQEGHTRGARGRQAGATDMTQLPNREMDREMLETKLTLQVRSHP